MTLPASLLATAEAHACFTGCYRYDSTAEMCVDPAAPTQRAFVLSCEDCLTFHLGVLASALPNGTTGYRLGDELTAHMRALRGYRWAVSGYRAVGPGLWISAACCADGLFLVDGSRNRGPNDVDVLVQAFRLGIAQPSDPGMLDPALYSAQLAYVNLAQPIGPVRTKQDVLSAPQCSPTPKAGHHRVSIVEYLPLVAALPSPLPAANGSTPSPTRPGSKSRPPGGALRMGDVCPECGAEVRERPLFSGTFVGCLC